MSISGGKTNRPVAGTTERSGGEIYLGDQIIARSGRPGMEALVPRSLTQSRIFVYVATPLRGQYPNCEDEISLNYERADVILRTIARNYAQVVPLSPLHAFRFMSASGSQDRAMDLCGDLLSLCHELWLFGDWKKSEGCSEERTLAMVRGLEVMSFPLRSCITAIEREQRLGHGLRARRGLSLIVRCVLIGVRRTTGRIVCGMRIRGGCLFAIAPLPGIGRLCDAGCYFSGWAVVPGASGGDGAVYDA